MPPGRVLTTYVPELEEAGRREQERRVVQEGTAMWRRRKEELQRQKHREQRELRQMQSNYSPWGKPGGGAPYVGSIRKKNVLLEPLDFPRSCVYSSQGWTSDSLIARLREGKEEIDPIAPVDTNKFFDVNSRIGIAPDPHPEVPSSHTDAIFNRENSSSYKNDRREEVQVYKLTGGVELVPLMTRYHYTQPHGTRYVATDATRPGYTIESLRSLDVGNRDHINALAEQMRRKHEISLEERKLEQESCRRHFDTWRRLWGRPGHGAPLDHAQRNDLYNILYRSAVY